MPLRPTDRYTWERILERAELPPAAKLVGYLMAIRSNTDGSRVRPGVARLAAATDWSPEHVTAQIKLLCGVGLLECVHPAAGPGKAATYRLTLPGEESDPVPMRLDPDGVRLTERPKGRGGRKPKDRTPVRPSGAEHPNSSSGVDAENPNSSSGIASRSPNSSSGESPNSSSGDQDRPGGMPELQLANTRTAVSESPNSSSPHQLRPILTTPVSGSYLTPTSAGAKSESDKTNHAREPDPATAYRAARLIVDAAPQRERDSALAQASQLISQRGGVSNVRAQTILAAELLGDLQRLTQHPEAS